MQRAIYIHTAGECTILPAFTQFEGSLHYGFSSSKRAITPSILNLRTTGHGDTLGRKSFPKADPGAGSGEGDIIALGECGRFSPFAEAGCSSIPGEISCGRVGQTVVAEYADQSTVGIETPGTACGDHSGDICKRKRIEIRCAGAG